MKEYETESEVVRLWGGEAQVVHVRLYEVTPEVCDHGEVHDMRRLIASWSHSPGESGDRDSEGTVREAEELRAFITDQQKIARACAASGHVTLAFEAERIIETLLAEWQETR